MVALGIASAGAAGGGQKDAKTLGPGDTELKPDCGPNYCEAVGSLTTFITRVGDKENPSVAPSNGRVVAWAVELGRKPKGSTLEFFQETFGSERYGNGPVARVVVLKRQGTTEEYKLKAQSPEVKLSGPFYNEDTLITLNEPLRIKEGEVVGLTSHTWTPTLRSRSRGGGSAAWRASLGQGKCNENGIINGKPQNNVGTVRDYSCRFTDRLFYRAYFVAN